MKIVLPIVFVVASLCSAFCQDSLVNIYFYRPKDSSGSNATCHIFFGNNDFGTLEAGSIKYYRIKPGAQTFSVKAIGETMFTITLTVGATNYVQCGVNRSGTPTLEKVSAQVAQEEFIKISPGNSGLIVDDGSIARYKKSLVQSGPLKRIKLTNTKNKILYIEKGQRIQYLIKSSSPLFKNTPSAVGEIQWITTDSMMVNSKSFPLSDLKSIGRKRKGSGFGAFITGAFGAIILANAVFPRPVDPCPSCTSSNVSSSDDAAGRVVQAVIGSGLAILSINTGIRNSPRDLKVWKIETTE